MEKTPPATFMGRPVQVAHTGKAWCENFSVVVALPAGATPSVWRNKVDGSQTSCPGGESYSELSATGRRSDLYSAFRARRNSRGFTF